MFIDTNVEEMKASCIISNVTKDQVGVYTCKAVNDVSEEVTKAKLELASTSLATKEKSVTETSTSIKESSTSFREMSALTAASSTKESTATKAKKLKSHKKVAHTQKSAKEESKTEVILSQTQRGATTEIETSAETQLETMNRAHLAVVRESDRHSDASTVEVTTRNERFEDEDEDVEILEETEEIHVKIYKEVFSVEEMENFKVADEVNSILRTIEAHQFGSGERPLRELATIGHLLKKGVEIAEITQLYNAEFFPSLKLPESQSALVQLVERQGYENLIAEILHTDSSEDEHLLASTVGFRAFMRMVEVTKMPIEEIITNFKFEDFVSQEWKHKEIKDNEFVEVTESHVSNMRTEKVSVIGNEFD